MTFSYDRRLQAVTTPLPPRFPNDEIGLMTLEEFLRFRNPRDKHHQNAYDWALIDMNRDLEHQVGQVRDRQRTFTVLKAHDGYRIVDDRDKLVGIVHGGVGYYDDPGMKVRFPRVVFADRGSERIDLGVTSLKQVKYLAEYTPLISPIAKLNRAAYPVVLQHLLVKGEPMVLRAEKRPRLNKHDSLAILNQDGYIVAKGQDEWGATLLAVAREYRGKGLGKIIGRYWYEYNPASESGGFTSAGEANAIALWKERVREFSAQGWYSQLIRDGRLTYDQVKAILKDAGQRPPPKAELADAPVKATGEILCFADGISFIVYDRAFLEEQDERFIHGFGFLRDAHPVGTYFFRIEYDRPFAELTTKVGLQMARDNGDKLYDGEGYHDLMEDLDKYPGVEREGDYLIVTRDLVPLRSWAAKEKRLRKAVDPYDEKYYSLQELANAKWD